MKQSQQLEIADPNVDRFTVECGVISHSVAIRLQCRSKATIELQIERLERIYGSSARIREPHQDGRGGWIAYGSLAA
jgi:hypothetical protein